MHDLDLKHMKTEPSEVLKDHPPVAEPVDRRLNMAKSRNKGIDPPGGIRPFHVKIINTVCKHHSYTV